MRRGLSKVFRSNLVAFDTDVGVRYAAPPTFWSRVYLIWTFRNFRSLPKQVFNRHQQRLMDELIRSSTIFPATKIDRSAVIGIVEQVRLSSSAMSHLETELRASEADDVIPLSHRDRQAWNGQNSSQAPESLQSETSIPQLVAPRLLVAKKTGAWILLAGSLLLAAFFLPSRIHVHSLTSHPNSGPATLAKPVWSQVDVQNVAANPGTVAAAQPVLKPREKAQEQLTPGQLQPSSNLDRTQSAPAGLLGSSGAREGPVSFASLATPTALSRSGEAAEDPTRGTSEANASLPRLSGPPQSHMVYPSYPETEQNGKVILTAIVGQDGVVKSITVIAGKKIFATSALKAVKQWRYLPYELEGKRVDFQTTIGFDFRGDEVVSVSFPQL